MTTTPEEQALAELYAAINRNDIPAALEFLDPDIVRVEPEGFPTAGTYRGHAELEAHLSKGRGTWAEGACEPEEYLVAGDKYIVCLHVLVRLKDHADWIDGRMADGYLLREGKVIEWRSFAHRSQALSWAGLADSPRASEI
jgi:ketosteroid isomerase-like protein